MTTELNGYSYLYRLVEVILQRKRTHSPTPLNSRILTRKDTTHLEVVVFLLAQIKDKTLFKTLLRCNMFSKTYKSVIRDRYIAKLQ